MKKIIGLTILAVILLISTNLCAVQANDVCPECNLYEYDCTLPYITPAEEGWWTGVVITNVKTEDALCRIDYVGDNSVERLDIAGRSQTVFIAPVTVTSYARIRSSGPLDIVTIISDNNVAYGYDRKLELINPAQSATETEVAK